MADEARGGRPNVLFFHVDNLGFGELSCYSGGPFRGATTSRIDAFGGEGFRLTNYCPEAQCAGLHATQARLQV
jgi:arylsulfatase A-like enzyme